MKNMMRRLISAVACLILILPMVGITPVSANSAQTIWSGVTSSGVIVEDENCPLIVEKETLTFNIPELPENYYASVEDFVQYSASVTAEYTFYNPSDYTVTATLAFPFGNMPDYGVFKDEYSGAWAHETAEHTRLYGVSVNGEPIESTLRHTYSDPYGNFILEEDLPKLRNGYAEDPFYRPDMPVTQYIIKTSRMEAGEGFASVSVSSDNDSRRILASEFNSYYADGSVAEYGRWTKNYESFTIYVVGEPLEEPPQWKFYEDGSQKTEISGIATVVSTQTGTFRDLALMEYDPGSGISEIDWYNAFVDGLGRGAMELYGFDISFNLMRWYEYEITLAPGERITNSVTAPIYPGINGQYEPATYNYTYLLSPATTWSEFGSLDIVIHTPYHLISSNQEQFEKTDTGYQVSLEGLPDGELEFTLSSEEKPKKRSPDYGAFFMVILLYLLVFAVPVFAVGFAAVIIIKALGKRVKKKEKT